MALIKEGANGKVDAEEQVLRADTAGASLSWRWVPVTKERSGRSPQPIKSKAFGLKGDLGLAMPQIRFCIGD